MTRHGTAQISVADNKFAAMVPFTQRTEFGGKSVAILAALTTQTRPEPTTAVHIATSRADSGRHRATADIIPDTKSP
jgi:hypothetical protein